MDALKFISDQMDVLDIPYEFMEWTSKETYPYFTGEITEEPIETEDGLEESVFFLNGFYRGEKYISLETTKEKIKKHFHPIHGLRGRTDSGTIAVFYGGAFYIPTNEADLKRIQITLNIKEWKGDI